MSGRILLVLTTGRWWQIVVAVLSGLYAWSATEWRHPKVPDSWKGIDLTLGQNLGRDSSIRYHRGLIATVLLKGEEERLAVLPESALGLWTQTVACRWQHGLQGFGITVIAGAAVIDADRLRQYYGGNLGARAPYSLPPAHASPGFHAAAVAGLMGERGGANADFFALPASRFPA